MHGLEKADVLFHNLVAEKKVPGFVVTILNKGEIVLQKGYGFSNLEEKLKVDPKQTVFRIASISKCITGLTLGKMVEDGILNLDESFYTYVPYYPKKKYDFTLRQLATHTAGIRSYRGKEFALNQDFSIKDSISVFKDDPLLFEPGKGYLYNSFDFVLLSLAMQEASGVLFQDYVRETILMPLGLKNTVSPKENIVSSSGVENQAQFYTKRALCFTEATQVNNNYKLAAGGYMSTCEDVVKLGQAILEQKLLKKETYDQLLTSQMVKDEPTYYGLGFQVSQDSQGRPFVGHVGSNVGAYTNLFVYPEQEKVIAILINCTDPKIQNELDLAINAIFEEDV
ncbi:CubicO group peptidase, beta-lactamase class C family [Flagellimonas zhangzhouensis]|uniref:CubicO group peptidase, beta-lactamase class C family n=2 Tax=Flagellimonas zhangzhouensis TaxID=1073328 RepID=A0A1H2X761_9FLAO|nr:CubicO group peptidase, beta-lactamase class C family [Allomuricauda zhangzhouensis]SDW88720.1 CubicO group peptidase, beta-lactamase class C family [Allomuricauda zhangzhouensis]